MQSCKDDSYLLEPPPVPSQSFVEEFDTAQKAYDRGWRFINRSEDIGRTNWQNPTDLTGIPFISYSGTGNGYLWADYQSTSAQAATISNWAVSPEIIMQNGDRIIFYTRTELSFFNGDSTDFVNRMQVRMNKTTSLYCGDGIDPGDFTVPLLDINPFYYEFLKSAFNNPSNPLFQQARQAYPHVWTRFEATVVGLNEPTKGRFAFRYFTEGAGSNGRGSSIGIDSVAYISKN
ncbi:MAG TPA: choice-of-anchor J domain-containing protein [Chitinophagaceae bacterium]|nr:choice-of-anchor J domain-containing protein [Chitinophagaceae bacterium]